MVTMIHISTKDQLTPILASIKTRAGRSNVLAEVDLGFFRCQRAYALLVDETPVSISVVHFGRKKKNSWEPYANWFTAFTTPDDRRKGYASLLARHMEKEAVSFGCVRLKALAGTVAGLGLHVHLKHEAWAITPLCEILIDTPLVPGNNVGLVPPTARKFTQQVTPLTTEVIAERLDGRLLRYERTLTDTEVEGILSIAKGVYPSHTASLVKKSLATISGNTVTLTELGQQWLTILNSNGYRSYDERI